MADNKSHRACKTDALGLQIFAWGLQIHRTGLHTCCTEPANILHRACQHIQRRACKFIAQSLRIYCTGSANTLHRTCEYNAQNLQIHCTRPANAVHRACKCTAQGLQMHCTGLANTVPRAGKYTAQGLQIHCARPTNILHRACHTVHRACAESCVFFADGPMFTDF